MADGHGSSTPRIFSPSSEDERFLWLRLLRSRRVGPTTFHRLMADHGSAAGALEALPEIAAEAGVEDYQICPPEVIEHELIHARKIGATLICYGSEAYPSALYDLCDAPPLLWARGNIGLLKQRMLALVGARNASSLGRRMARALAKELGEYGYVTVSGLARGIDAEVHKASIESGTIAMLAGGVDVIYPTENTELAKAIAQQGLLISEQPIGQTPQARHFPTRNRLISGLAQATIVIEAAAKSGSLITARNALDQGRDVLAVPGHPFDARASGCNILIRDGATLVRKAEDIIEALAPLAAHEPVQKPLPLDRPAPRSLRDTAALHQQILSRLGPTPVTEDQLVEDLKSSVRELAPVLSSLELEGQISRQSGGLLSRP